MAADGAGGVGGGIELEILRAAWGRGLVVVLGVVGHDACRGVVRKR